MNQDSSRAATSWSARVDAALRFAAAAHHEDVRKGTQIPYVMHPFHVGLILDRHGFPEDVVIAGIFHDVLALVAHVTERKLDEAGKKRLWGVRKKEQLRALQNASPEQAVRAGTPCGFPRPRWIARGTD
jgi:(p)ppGpp synthase/HD superfamily hydrolase